MEVLTAIDVHADPIESFPYKGVSYPVNGVTIRWLSKVGLDPESPEYGLRLFTIAPGGGLPRHNHFYTQTMYIVSGKVLTTFYDSDTDEVIWEKVAAPGDIVFVPSMETHGSVNASETEEAQFLCCVCNVYED